jgi:hypothetical protein
MDGRTAGDNWNCPNCGHAQVLDKKRFDYDVHRLQVAGGQEGNKFLLEVESIVCANNECRELSLRAQLLTELAQPDASGNPLIFPSTRWTLLPPSSAKPQPSYIPKPIRDDYHEACAIRDLSPKASATITRRCLQGMIRDFCRISKKRLIDEINDLRAAVQQGKAPIGVQPDSIEAIDYVRQIGNIGAHMEADINVIVDVDSDEAQILIGLVELLFEEWYVARETRESGFAKLKAIAAQKKAQQQPPTPPQSGP